MQGLFKNLAQITIISVGLIGIIGCGGSNDKKDVAPPVKVASNFSDETNEQFGVDPYKIDTDGDGLSDDFEISFISEKLSPTQADSDGNGISDGQEDYDQDGWNNLSEQNNKTSPYLADTDYDGLPDPEESKYQTDPLNSDTDNDGINDGIEVNAGLSPTNSDSDGDGINDLEDKDEIIVSSQKNTSVKIQTSVENIENIRLVSGLISENNNTSSYELFLAQNTTDLDNPLSISLPHSTNENIMIQVGNANITNLPENLLIQNESGGISINAHVSELLNLAASAKKEKSLKSPQNNEIDTTQENITNLEESNTLLSALKIKFIVISWDWLKSKFDNYFSQNLPKIGFSYSLFNSSSLNNGVTKHTDVYKNSIYFKNVKGAYIDQDKYININTKWALGGFGRDYNQNDYTLTLYFDSIEQGGTLFYQQLDDNKGFYNYTFITKNTLNDNQPVAITLIKDGAILKTYANGKLLTQRNILEDEAKSLLNSKLYIGKPLPFCKQESDEEQCKFNTQLKATLLHIELTDNALSAGELRNQLRYRYKSWTQNQDRDQDGLLDFEELVGFVNTEGEIIQTHFNSADTDNDGILDQDELGEPIAIDPNQFSSKKHKKSNITNSADVCTSEQIKVCSLFAYQGYSNPTNYDSDFDGISDMEEYNIGTDPNVIDTDKDGLTDFKELQIETDPTAIDTDGDGIPDGIEYYFSGEANITKDLNLFNDNIYQELIDMIAEVNLGFDPLVKNNFGIPDNLDEIKLTVNYLQEEIKKTTTFKSKAYLYSALAYYKNLENKAFTNNIKKIIQIIGLSQLNNIYSGSKSEQENAISIVLAAAYAYKLDFYQRTKAEVIIGILKGDRLDAANEYQAFGQIIGLAAYFQPYTEWSATARDITVDIFKDKNFVSAATELALLFPYAKNIKVAEKLVKIVSNIKIKHSKVIKKALMTLDIIPIDIRLATLAAQLGFAINLNDFLADDEQINSDSISFGAAEKKSNKVAKIRGLGFSKKQLISLLGSSPNAVIKGLAAAQKRAIKGGSNITISNLDNVAGVEFGMFIKTGKNKHWRSGEKYIHALCKKRGGDCIEQMRLFDKQTGKIRIPDSFALKRNGKYEAHESKVGPVTYTTRIKKEIANDCAMLKKRFKTKSKQNLPSIPVDVEKITWHFMPSGENKKSRRLGMSARVLEELACPPNGPPINIEIHVPNAKVVIPGIIPQKNSAKNSLYKSANNIAEDKFSVRVSFGYREIPDSDNDGINDLDDAFPNDARYQLDSDFDGMADAWEILYGLDPLSNGCNSNTCGDTEAYEANQDPDKDGLNNLEEFLNTLALGANKTGYNPLRASPVIPKTLSIYIPVGEKKRIDLVPLTTWTGDYQQGTITFIIDSIEDGLTNLENEKTKTSISLKVNNTVTKGRQLTIKYQLEYNTGERSNNATITVNTQKIQQGTGKLNDTGITTCANNSSNNLACPVTGFEGQDAEYGRDAQAAAGTLTKVGAGKSGFDFTKLDANGNALPASATEWVCVKDNHTGLVWEVKTTDGGLRDKNNTYTWYNSNTSTNGGNAGIENGGSCPDTGNCDTEKYVASVNALNQGQGLCGADDWRMPSREELRSIVDYGSYNPVINTNYFINTQSHWYWSASAYVSGSYPAWIVSFYGGYDGSYESLYNYVRLVRGG